MQHGQGDLGDVRLLGVCDRYLLAGRREQRRAGPDDCGGVLGTESHTHVGGAGHHIELAAEGDVGSDVPVLRHDDLAVQRQRE